MVKYSRIAIRETNANSRMTPVLPPSRASPMTATITHQALTRALRLSMTGCGAPRATRNFNARPTAEATTRMPATPAVIHKVYLSTNSPVVSGRARLRGDVEQRLPRAREERAPFLALPDRERHAEIDRAQQRHRHGLALRQHPPQVLHPDRHQLDVRPARGKPVEPALEWQ